MSLYCKFEEEKNWYSLIYIYINRLINNIVKPRPQTLSPKPKTPKAQPTLTKSQ